MPYIPYPSNPFNNPSPMFAPPFDFHHRAAELRKRFQNSQSSNYSFASGDNINPFGNYHFISRIFPQRNNLISQNSVHPGFSIFKSSLRDLRATYDDGDG